MKLNRLFYLLSLPMLFSWSLHSMEDPKNVQNPLESLQKIVREAFPPLVYEAKKDLSRDEYIKFTTSEGSGLFSILSTELFSMISGLFQKSRTTSEGCDLISRLPTELLFIISDFLNPQSLGRFGATCPFFYTKIQKFPLYLNNYCLQEAMPHAIPIDILVRKTKNTKDGIFKLANLYSVSDRDLLAWFGQSYLKEIISAKGDFSITLRGRTEEQLEALYPLLKVKMAAALPETNKPAWMTDIMELYHGYFPSYYKYTMSFNTMRLFSLCRNTSRDYSELFTLFCDHLFPRARRQERSSSSNYQAFDIVARDLLMAGHKVTTVNNYYYWINPKKKDVATQIIQWCYDHLWDFEYHSDEMIRNAQRLNEPELAFQILLKVITFPKDQTPFKGPGEFSKINAFILYASDERVKEPIQKFAQELYAQHWTTLSDFPKKTALRLFLRTNNHESFKTAFAELRDNRYMLCPLHANDDLIKDLFTYGFEEEGSQLIQRILADQGEVFLPSIYALESFIDHAIKRDREALISKLKAELESPTSRLSHCYKLTVLTGLARHKKETEEAYIMHQATLLYKAWKIDGNEMNSRERQFAALYFYLNQKALCQKHYHRWVDALLPLNEVRRSEFLDELREMGLSFNSIEDMRIYDPFEIIKLTFQKK